MRLRRCRFLLIEPRERRGLDLAATFAGQARMTSEIQWLAFGAHRDGEIPLDPDMLAALDDLAPGEWQERSTLERRHSAEAITRLIAAGIAIVEGATDSGDDTEHYWHGWSAVMHRQLRWRNVHAATAGESTDGNAERSLLDRLGAPPPPTKNHRDGSVCFALPTAPSTPLTRLAAGRTTCRNFDPHPLDATLLASVLDATYGARAVSGLPGIPAVKKNVPSAGGLHPVEAYLLVQRVDGIAPGLYRYHPIDRVLECLKPLNPAALPDMASRFVAGQHWFVGAPVFVVLVARFVRNFWKYRQHAKAYRAIVLDAGHLSQMQYLVATEFGLAAFITAAVNEGDIEEAFGLDPMAEGVLAVTGFGWRATTMTEQEFDPLGVVWPTAAKEGPLPAG